MEKKTIRQEILNKKEEIDQNTLKSYSESIINQLYNTEYYKKAKIIMTFISFGAEVDTHDFIKNSIEKGKRIVVPITVPETKQLKLSEVFDFGELEVGFYDILTPKEEFIRYVDPSEVDLIIVPGVAFDRNGYRIGYGGGYYDRFLANLDHVTKISLAFDMQLIPKIPTDHYDIPVNYIITENEIIKCK